MNQEMMTVEETKDLVAKNENDAAIAKRFASGGTVPYIKLLSKMAKGSDDHPELLNHFVQPANDDFIDLGEELPAYVCAIRDSAMLFGEDVLISHIHDSPLFKKIMAYQKENPSGGAVFGPDFLLWLPEQEQFVTFTFGSKSARIERR